MRTFEEQMREHQVAWRKSSDCSTDWGWQNGRQYEHVLDRRNWEEGLWPGIRKESSRPLQAYLSAGGIQKHTGAHNLLSSWVLCANLYFPFGGSASGRRMLAGFLGQHVHNGIRSVEAVELEYAEDGYLCPSELLGEEGGGRGSGQTSPDVAFLVNRGRGLVLTENKFVEHSFYRCSARRSHGTDDRPGNPDSKRCLDVKAVVDDPDHTCHQETWGRKYWKCLKPAICKDAMLLLGRCPAATAGYQLLRQQALAEGIATSGKYSLVASCVAVDVRNATLAGCLHSTGLSDIRQWGSLFRGKARFAVFTHQDWVKWVAAHDEGSEWSDWLAYVKSRYGMAA